MIEAMSKNFVDHDAYPATADLESRCVAMISDLYHCPGRATGTSTIGSSEAIMLATLAMKKNWIAKRQSEGKDFSKPNLIMSSSVQICWTKAASFFDIEERHVFCSSDRFDMDPNKAIGLVDENTIGICSILGTTHTGQYEDTKALNNLLVSKNIDCPIHVDAASGGFVAPFLNPSRVWDFQLEKVASINVSGHKYGLVYSGIGWIVWRHPSLLPPGIALTVPSSVSLLTCCRFGIQTELPGDRPVYFDNELLPKCLEHRRSVLSALTAWERRIPRDNGEHSSCYKILGPQGPTAGVRCSFRHRRKRIADCCFPSQGPTKVR